MRLKSSRLLIISLLLLPACAAKPALIREKDSFTGESIIRTVGNTLPRENHAATVSLDARYLQPENGVGRYEFWVTVRNPRVCIEITPGESLFLFIDGKQKNYSSNVGSAPNQSFTKSPEALACTEYAVYQGIPRADLQDIVQAKSAQIKIASRHGDITATLTEPNLKAIASVVNPSTGK